MSDSIDNGAPVAQPKTKLAPALRRARGKPRTARARVANANARRAKGARSSSRDGKPLRAAEFFAGGGMVHQALKRVGVDVVWANDHCPEKRATYAANHPGTPLDPRSITEVSARDIPDVRIWHHSNPCTDFSTNGRRAGIAGERGVLAFQAARLLGEARREGRLPRVVAGENVVGWLTLNKGRDFAAYVTSLHSEGFVVGAVVMRAEPCVPQKRTRLFTAAVPRGTAIPKGLTVSRPNKRWHPPILRRAVKALPPEVRKDWVWWTMPEQEESGLTLADIVEQEAR